MCRMTFARKLFIRLILTADLTIVSMFFHMSIPFAANFILAYQISAANPTWFWEKRKGRVPMAATRLIALHKNKGKSVAACLKSRTDYAQNPDKTQQGELVSSYECSPLTVDEEFMLSKRQYELMTGRRQKNDVIAYQIRQSFKPDRKSVV